MKIIEKNKIFEGFLNIIQLTLKYKNKTFQRLVMERKNAVAGIIFNKRNRTVIFTKQWRPGSESSLIEIFAGVTDESEDEIESLKMEALEEVGYSLEYIEHINTCYLSPGGSTEKISIYYCEGEYVSKGGGLKEEDEYIEIIEIPLDLIEREEFFDAKTIIAINFIKDKFLR
jgi:ADP-ribose pyrophosphatase